MTDHIPKDIMLAIFSRLPIKSLARLRCVCKSWLKYINDPCLKTIHRVDEQPRPIMIEQLPPVGQTDNNNRCIISYLRVIKGTRIVQKETAMQFYYRCPLYAVKEKLVLG